jgi:hypothetical protein
MLDVEQLKILITIAFLLLIIDSAYSIAFKLRLIHKCRVLCEESEDSYT